MELDKNSCSGRHLFHRILPNYGNTCFFIALLQLLASMPSFVEQIIETPLPPDHADSLYCLTFLKHFIPAIASPSSDPCQVLDISSVGDVTWKMSTADWIDFVTRLASRHDASYALGAFADPDDLLQYFMSIVPGVAHMCETIS